MEGVHWLRNNCEMRALDVRSNKHVAENISLNSIESLLFYDTHKLEAPKIKFIMQKK